MLGISEILDINKTLYSNNMPIFMPFKNKRVELLVCVSACELTWGGEGAVPNRVFDPWKKA